MLPFGSARPPPRGRSRRRARSARGLGSSAAGGVAGRVCSGPRFVRVSWRPLNSSGRSPRPAPAHHLPIALSERAARASGWRRQHVVEDPAEQARERQHRHPLNTTATPRAPTRSEHRRPPHRAVLIAAQERVGEALLQEKASPPAIPAIVPPPRTSPATPAPLVILRSPPPARIHAASAARAARRARSKDCGPAGGTSCLSRCRGRAPLPSSRREDDDGDETIA